MAVRVPQGLVSAADVLQSRTLDQNVSSTGLRQPLWTRRSFIHA